MSSTVLDYMKSGLTLVNHTNIGEYKGQYVIVHGQVQSVKNGTLTLLTDSNNHEFLINNFTKDVPAEEYLMIVGKVDSDKSLEFVDMINLCKDFDLEFVNELIQLSHPHISLLLLVYIKSNL